MVRKRTARALEELLDALDPDGNSDAGLIAALSDDLRDRLIDVLSDVQLELRGQLLSDGRGRRSGKGPEWEEAHAYFYMHPPSRGTTHFDRDTKKKLFAKSQWAQDFVEHMEARGVAIEQAKYMFDDYQYPVRGGR